MSSGNKTEMDLGIQTKCECPECGNIIHSMKILVVGEKSARFDLPEKCACGRKTGFALLGFEPINVTGYELDKSAIIVHQDYAEEVRKFAVRVCNGPKAEPAREIVNEEMTQPVAPVAPVMPEPAAVESTPVVEEPEIEDMTAKAEPEDDFFSLDELEDVPDDDDDDDVLDLDIPDIS